MTIKRRAERRPSRLVAHRRQLRAKLVSAKLTRAELTRAELTRAQLTRAEVVGADLSSPEAGIFGTRIAAG